MAKIVKLIAASALRGKGTQDDPVRQIEQLWTKKGELVAEFDPEKDKDGWFVPPASLGRV